MMDFVKKYYNSHAGGRSLWRLLTVFRQVQQIGSYQAYSRSKFQKKVRIWQLEINGLHRDHSPAQLISDPALFMFYLFCQAADVESQNYHPIMVESFVKKQPSSEPGLVPLRQFLDPKFGPVSYRRRTNDQKASNSSCRLVSLRWKIDEAFFKV